MRNQEQPGSHAIPVVFGKVLRKKHANAIGWSTSGNQSSSKKYVYYQYLIGFDRHCDENATKFSQLSIV
jgi:hypothetical protein